MNPILLEERRRILRHGQWTGPDAQAWDAALRRRGRGLGTQAKKWAEATRFAVEQSWGRFSGFLLRTGRSDHSTRPEAKVIPDNLDAFDAHMVECGNRVSTRIKRFGHIAMALKVMAPGFDTRFITHPGGLPLACQLPKEERPDKPIFDSRFILARAEELFELAIAMKSDARRRTAVRDAALLTVLATCAPRRRSLLAMRVGVQMIRTASGFELHLRRVDMKERNRLDHDLTERITRILDRYQKVEREEMLGAARHDSFWVNVRGEPLKYRALDGAVRYRTRTLLGHEMGGHAFRHCLRTTAAFVSRQTALDAPIVMGHSPQVSREDYDRSTGIQVAGRHVKWMVDKAKRLEPLAASRYGWRKKKIPPSEGNILY